MPVNYGLSSSGSLATIGNPLPVQNFGKVTISMPSDGSRQLVVTPIQAKTPVAGVETRAVSSPAVLQTDLINLNSIAAGASLVVDLGQIAYFLDMGGNNALALGDVLMIDPNGIAHDLACWTIEKTDHFDPPGLVPGRYTFINVSGGALANLAVYAVHVGSRNLA